MVAELFGFSFTAEMNEVVTVSTFRLFLTYIELLPKEIAQEPRDNCAFREDLDRSKTFVFLPHTLRDKLFSYGICMLKIMTKRNTTTMPRTSFQHFRLFRRPKI